MKGTKRRVNGTRRKKGAGRRKKTGRLLPVEQGGHSRQSQSQPSTNKKSQRPSTLFYGGSFTFQLGLEASVSDVCLDVWAEPERVRVRVR